MTVGLVRHDATSLAPLQIYWLNDERTVASHRIDRPPAIGEDEIEATFRLRRDGHPEIEPRFVWDELVEDRARSTPTATAWAAVDLGEDPASWLIGSAKAWLRKRFGRGADAHFGSEIAKRRYRFAAVTASHLATAALGVVPGSAPRRLLPVGVGERRPRISTRIVPFVDAADDCLIVCVGAQEPPDDVEVALPYALALLGDRELRLVLPASSEAPTSARLPWFDAPIRLFTHESDDPASVREVPPPTRALVLRQFSDTISTATPDLGPRAAWVADLVVWADRHEELVAAHRSSYQAWHCRGRQVLQIRRSRAGFTVRVGVVSKAAVSPLAAGKDMVVTAPIDEAALDVLTGIAQTAIDQRVTGVDTLNREHRFQSRLMHGNLAVVLGVDATMMRREFPAFRPRVGRMGRGFIDFLALDRAGVVHIIETKIDNDPMIALQVLDYVVWAAAHRHELANVFDVPEVRGFQVDFVVVRSQGQPVADEYTKAVLERFSRDVRWRIYEAVGDLDGTINLEAVPSSEVLSGRLWAQRIQRRVEAASDHVEPGMHRGWFPDATGGLAPGGEHVSRELADREALHPYFGHVRSSQRFAVNLFAGLDRSGVAELLSEWFGPVVDADVPTFEWFDPHDRLRESTVTRPHRTQVDVLLTGRTIDGRRVGALIEVKLTEPGFGGCSHAEVAPEHAERVCFTDGAFGSDPQGCWQLRNRDSGTRRRYDEYIDPDAQPSIIGCWFRTLNQPMRLAALAAALQHDDPMFDDVVVALCAPVGHHTIWRDWSNAKRCLPGRLVDLPPEDVATFLPDDHRLFLADRYGTIGPTRITHRPPSNRLSASDPERATRETHSWQLLAALADISSATLRITETHPGGGQYDCLTISDPSGQPLLDLNRRGSLHFTAAEAKWPDIWDRLTHEAPTTIAHEITNALPRSAPTDGDATHSEYVAALATMATAITELAPVGWEWRHINLYEDRPAVSTWLNESGMPRPTEIVEPCDASAASDTWLLVHPQLAWPIAAVRLDATAWTSLRTFRVSDTAGRTQFIHAVAERATGTEKTT